MSLNWREIDAVLEELPLAGSQVQKIRQPDFSSLVLELYRPDGRYTLYICLAQNATRIHRLTRRVENTVPLQRFAQLLRSRIKSAKIREARQIESDRIIRIDLVRAGVESILWIRLWSNAANIILTEPDGTIIDAFYRRPRRGEVTGGNFPAKKEGAPQKPGKEYSVRDFPGTGTLSEKIENYYFSDRRDAEVALLKQRLEKQLTGEEAKLRFSIERARERIDGEEEIIRCKQIGDLLMSNLHTIAPGQSRVTLENFYKDGEELSIELDPSLSPEKNAQAYYDKSRKKKRRLKLARDEVDSLKRRLAETLRRAEAVKTDDDPESLGRLLATTENRGGVKAKENSRVPGLTFFSGPFTIYVGRTSRENDDLLRRYVRGNDYWLHSRDTPGAYVFIKSIKGKSVPLETLLDAGTLAVHYSKAKSSGRADLFYTQVKYLRRAKDGKQGLVIPTQEKNLSVAVEDKRLSRLLNPAV